MTVIDCSEQNILTSSLMMQLDMYIDPFLFSANPNDVQIPYSLHASLIKAISSESRLNALAEYFKLKGIVDPKSFTQRKYG